MTEEEHQDITRYLTWEVKGGFTSEEELQEDLEEILEMHMEEVTPNDLDEAAKIMHHLFVAQRAEEAKWIEPTKNDAIDAAFAELNVRGIIALQNAGFTVTDGWADVHEAAADYAGEPRGAVFYHEQDRDLGVDGEGLMLAFGAFHDLEAEHIAVAREVMTVLKQHGIETEWSGTVDQRICIPPFLWQKRQWSAIDR